MEEGNLIRDNILGTNPAMSSSTPTTVANVAHSSNVAALQLALANAMQREAELSARLRTFESNAQNQPKCYFLKTIPLEIRQMIYRYLLVNPVLGTSNSISRKYWRTDSTNLPEDYELSLEILRTSSTIYREASDILYGSNTFIFEAFSNGEILCPLFRDLSPRSIRKPRTGKHSLKITHFDVSSKDFEPHLNVIQKVKHWKVLLSAHRSASTSCPALGFVFLCRIMCDAPPKSLDVRILPNANALAPHHKGCYQLSRVLQPLLLLREVTELRIGHTEPCDFPLSSAFQGTLSNNLQSHLTYYNGLHGSQPKPDTEASSVNIPEDFKQKMKGLVQSNKPVIRVFKMYHNLLRYAQAFERNELFCSAMDPRYGESRKKRATSSRYWNREEERSIFKSPSLIHPVEHWLELASIASEDNDVQAFVTARSNVLAWLERQYMRICTGAENISRFIRDEKVHGGLFDIDPPPMIPGLLAGAAIMNLDELELETYPSFGGRHMLSTGLVLLLKYRRAFARDVTPDIKKELHLSPRKWKLAYANLPREILVAQLEVLLEGDRVSNHTAILGIFKKLVDDMDKQYLMIRKFRKGMFDEDPTGLEYGFDKAQWCQKQKCDEMINWDVLEPNMMPKIDPSVPRSKPHSPVSVLPPGTDVDNIPGLGYPVDWKVSC